MRRGSVLYFAAAIILTACGTARHAYSPSKKYSPGDLQKDFAIYREILQESHPGLYWYTGRDSMNYFFDQAFVQLKDSMTEMEFRKILSYVTSKVRCGHTSVRPSRAFSGYFDSARTSRLFPLGLKIWPGNGPGEEDTAVITVNLNRQDSVLVRGTPVKKIGGIPIRAITDTLFQYIPTDGYNTTHKYQSLSNRGYFGYLYTLLFGSFPQYSIQYIDSTGIARDTLIKNYHPIVDTAARAAFSPARQLPQPSGRERKLKRRQTARSLRVDSLERVAYMDLNSFGRGYGLPGFFRHSFRDLRKKNIGHLVIDVRSNGGGSVNNSTQITRYLSHHPFKVADSLYAIVKKKKYGKYIRNDFFNRLFITFLTRKKSDGYYHFSYFEKHHFKPKRRNHFDGKVYILTGGNSFSATTLFASTLMDQENVVIVGEETGGGAYGNSAWLIPDVTLPNTKLRFRLPLFRLVINKDYPKTGRGVQPEVESRPSVEAIRQGIDFKMKTALQLIQKDKESKKAQMVAH